MLHLQSPENTSPLIGSGGLLCLTHYRPRTQHVQPRHSLRLDFTSPNALVQLFYAVSQYGVSFQPNSFF